jgi:uncharacterized SAM-binding protein YcdF (DUF218 family)
MMFTFTKVLQSLLLPPGIFLILMAVGFFIRKDCRLLGKLLMVSGYCLLYFASISPVTDVLIRPLESTYPPLKQTPATMKADAIVVLGGGVRDLSWIGLAPDLSETGVERVVRGVSLYRSTRIPLMMVGGNGNPGKEEVSESDAMSRVAKSLGVPERELTIVGKVRNTLESADAVKRRLKGNRIILVTSAVHMRRAAGMFRKKGFEVIPAACGYRGEQSSRTFISFIPRADNLHYSASAIAEYLSLAWYRIRGDL